MRRLDQTSRELESGSIRPMSGVIGLLGVVLLAKGDRDDALFEMKRANVVDGRQLGLAPI